MSEGGVFDICEHLERLCGVRRTDDQCEAEELCQFLVHVGLHKTWLPHRGHYNHLERESCEGVHLQQVSRAMRLQQDTSLSLSKEKCMSQV